MVWYGCSDQSLGVLWFWKKEKENKSVLASRLTERAVRFKGCASPCFCSSTSPSPLFTYPWRKRREKTRRALRPRTTLLPPLTRGGYSHRRRSPPRRLSHQPLLLPPLHLLLLLLPLSLLLLPLPLLLLPLPLLLLPLSLLLLPLAWRRRRRRRRRLLSVP